MSGTSPGRAQTSELTEAHLAVSAPPPDENIVADELRDWDSALFDEAGTGFKSRESPTVKAEPTSPFEGSPGDGRKRQRGEQRAGLEPAWPSTEAEAPQDSRRYPTTRPRARLVQPGSPRSYSSDSESDSRGRQRRGQRYSDKPNPATIARNKASRERLRRERLNDSFVELTKVLDPEKYLRAEKTTIIADTIKTLSSMRLENEQLRHEKQALKVELERAHKERETLHFQQSLLRQELKAAQAAQYSQHHLQALQQPPANFQGHAIAVGVPLSANYAQAHGGISRLMQGPPAGPMLPPMQMSSAPLAMGTPFAGMPPQRDASSAVPGEAFMLPSPPDLLDLHDFDRELSVFAPVSGGAPAGSHPGPQAGWLPPGDHDTL